jgi:ABC-type phosphate transport system substrate-binding protein
VAIVTANNGEVSKVKFLDTDAFLAPSNITQGSSTTNPAAGSAIIEYVATFPNVTVNTGEEYKACVLRVKDLEMMICTTGNNSPASRPEFVVCH